MSAVPQPAGADRLQAAIESLKSGRPIEDSPMTPEAVSSTDSTADSLAESTPDVDSTEFSPSKWLEEAAADSTGEDAESEPSLESSDSDDESVTPEEATSEKKRAAKSDDIEEVTITDSKGRRKVKVDFSDKDKIKKYVQLAAGARKWQVERDAEKARADELTSKLAESESLWKRVETAYQDSGLEGLVDLLEGKQGAYQEWRTQELEKEREYQSLSTYEKEQLSQQRLLEQEKREQQKLREQYETELRKIREEREAADMRSLEARLHPSFDRYRFAGKLGDPVAEHQLDEAIWSQALTNLEKLPEDIELTPALIDKEFRKVAGVFKNIFDKQTSAQVKTAVSKQKREATRNAQLSAKKGLTSSQQSKKKFVTDIKSGNYASALKDLMTGQFRFED